MEKQKESGSVLLVEDASQSASLLKTILEEEGYNITIAKDADEGMECARTEHLDLVISDIVIPGVDGFEFCMNLRRDPITSNIPFIFLSAKGSLADKQLAFREGADDFITKPFEPSELIMRVNALISRSMRYRQEAFTDPLTGLNNRRYFDKKLVEMISHSERYKEPFCLAMGDVDLFKSFNDTYGHMAGDQALIHIATFIKNYLRQSDITARFGGEEFTIILPSTDKETSAYFLDRLRSSLARTTMEYEGIELRFTVSLGVAEFPTDAKTSDELVKCADIAMYESKSAGRNMVTAYQKP